MASDSVKPMRRSAALGAWLAWVSGCGQQTNSACEADRPECFLPSAAVEVRRDSLGVPHLQAQTDSDAFWASGYLQATDRLFQMELTRRRALGRSAEVLGKSSVDEDVLLRTIGIDRLASDNVERARAESPAELALASAWVAGVNARIEEVRSGAVARPVGFDELGFDPEPWELRDPFAIGKLLLFGNANVIEYEILSTAVQAFRPDLFEAAPFFAPLYDAFVSPVSSPSAKVVSAERASGPKRAFPPDARARLAAFTRTMGAIRSGGSNNWAVRGEHTDSGRPLIAGDPHQSIGSPSLFWLHHIQSAERLDVIGFSFVGTPAVQLGHNASVAWTATTSYPDTMDLWEVSIQNGSVLLGGESLPTETRTETVLVRDDSPRDVLVTAVPGVGVLLPVDLAPLPITDVGNRMLLGWTGFEPTFEAQAFFACDVATSLDDIDAAADAMELGAFNFIAADASGITYRSSPKVPDRGLPPFEHPPFRMMPGDDPSTVWSGAMLPADRLPHGRGESRGFVASANNDPFGFTSDGELDGDPWYFGVFFDAGTRAQRIDGRLEELVASGSVSLGHMKELQLDTYSLVAHELVVALDSAISKVGIDPSLAAFEGRADLASLSARLSVWDRQMRLESSEAVVAHALAFFFARDAVGDDLDLFFEPILGAEPLYPIKFSLFALRGEAPALLAPAERDVVLLGALSHVSDWLTERFGGIEAERYTWADVKRTVFSPVGGVAALDGGAHPTQGANGTVDVGSVGFFEGDAAEGKVRDTFATGSGSIYRMVASFDAEGRPQAEINFPRGASGDPSSAYWDNGLADWIEGTYQPLRFREEDLAADVVEAWSIGP